MKFKTLKEILKLTKWKYKRNEDTNEESGIKENRFKRVKNEDTK